MRAQLLDQIFLRDARIEHAFDQQQVASREINLCAESDVLKAAERLMIQAQEGCAKRTVDGAQQICQKDEAIVQHAQDREVTSLISLADFPRQLFHTGSDCRRAINL